MPGPLQIDLMHMAVDINKFFRPGKALDSTSAWQGGKMPRMSRLVLFIFLLSAFPVFAGERFIDNKDDTVTDHQTGLMWAKYDNQGDIDWRQAERWIKYSLPLQSKYDDWRLPTLEELKSLYIEGSDYKGYETDCGQQVNIIPQILLSCGWVWTSEIKSITARVFNFNRGYHYTDRMVHYRAYRALPVRTIKKVQQKE